MILSQPFATTFAGEYVIPTLVVVTASTLAGAAAGFRRVISQGKLALIAAEKAAEAASAVAEDVTEVKTDIKEIRKEIHTNGGSSLKDSVLRQEADSKKRDEEMQKHLIESAGKQAEVDMRLTHLEQK